MSDVRISPVPTDDEAAAIVAALQVHTAHPATAVEETATRSGRWRFSGRWWSTPLAVRRARPWR